MTDHARWVLPRGTSPRGEWEVWVDDSQPGWQHTSLAVGTLRLGDERWTRADGWEHVVVPLSGSVRVRAEGHDEVVLAGREHVFAGPTDIAYLAGGLSFAVTAEGGPARVAVCGAKAPTRHTPAVVVVPAAQVPVELRGAGKASREVRNFGVPGVLAAEALIACEVVTPAGNWSSYPPHKHDEHRPGQETELEEIYYFEVQAVAGAPDGADPVGYQRVYGTDARPIDILAEVRTGDVVLVPHGWHGPSMATPGADLYYLNVMAGPGPERAWLICDDPAHTWVRDTWGEQAVDPRLPFGGNG
ncbi:5-deoxyglucuronate isomerase [Pedococcus dokdonensis]|uniref:5-deoxyglucuronate isomerase n=1 Tax=Pedococcus dokdonensis TaxID=443156 RepID=A0A1H0TFM1_9MICO|nr:5-deoxy-glucuronate isomerase [Pedococcus dokdonensis]SDP52631.1 5-deoxyglucuronate isomerase [Pedococcus dokdonensis]